MRAATIAFRVVRVLCLGETLVDLICERPVDRLADADAFAPHFGGAMANVCVVAARYGAAVELAGGAGDDGWGRWLQERLAGEGVGLEWFALVEGAPTALAFVTVDAGGEPDYLIYGAGIHAAMAAVAPRLHEAVAACDALVIASNTLLDPDERRATLDARASMLEHGKPVVFDPNLRLHRWENPGRAVTLSRECLPGLFLLKCNRHEAQLLSGEQDVERAAEALLAAGVANVVVSLGADGAMLRGAVRANVPGVPAQVVSATGAGDTMLGVLVARLAETRFYPAAIAAGLAEAVSAAARTTERWGAT
ncbi:carbohydrate kinase family protein [Capillimicrobium parvum]|uniref:carbohydrate kinase family protein n=1 Tax=Capillimicrobium parvum TaxID=2884022 RepID=UPI00216B0F39|nr:PfkB family carbohydrate kinase [Capillimicrobium parvum]